MARYAVGIDLGTTHCALSFQDLSLREEEAPPEGDRAVAIPQVTAVATVEERPLLPSFVYLPGASESDAKV